MGILFRGLEDDPDDLESVVRQGLGAASVCWEHLDATGVFLEHRAHEISVEILEWIKSNYNKREV